MGKTWCRLYAGTRNHRKIKALRRLEPVHWKSWYLLLELATECDAGGWIYVTPGVPFTSKALKEELGIWRESTLIRLILAMNTVNLLRIDERGILILGFSKRQFESDISTPRTFKYKEKQKSAKPQERPGNGQGTVTGTDQNRAEQNRTEKPPYPPLKKGASFSVQDLAKLWNEKAPPELARVNLPFKRADKDMNKIKDALKRNPEREWWVRVIFKMFNSPFLRGTNDRGWKATIAFMAREAEKILDGEYDGGGSSQSPRGQALKPADPNCPYCEGHSGLESVDKDGEHLGMRICRCRRVQDESQDCVSTVSGL